MREYGEDELLDLSGVQHFVFCRRQWALMAIEKLWADNTLTVEGTREHERVHDPLFNETRAGVISSRSLPVRSYTLGITGMCDLVEFAPAENGACLIGKRGKFSVTPVEYKHGKPKPDQRDEAQVCAQAMCLEEMLATTINVGFLFYAKTRRRHEVIFSEELRQTVRSATTEMHQYFARKYTPRPKLKKACASCSLVDLCLPGLSDIEPDIEKYIQRRIGEK